MAGWLVLQPKRLPFLPQPHMRTQPKQTSLLTSPRPPSFMIARSRTLATIADPPIRRYGGLKDQDRIFTNLLSRHDHGIKGAQVSPPLREVMGLVGFD